MAIVKPLTVVLFALIVLATIQLIAPGLGATWFGTDYAPDGWEASEKWVYLLTEVVPVLAFIAVGTLFWWLGRSTREEVVELSPVRAEAAG